MNAGMTVLAAQSREVKRGKFKGTRIGPVTLRPPHTAAYTRIVCMTGTAPYLVDCRDDADRALGVRNQRTLHPVTREEDDAERLARRLERGKATALTGTRHRTKKVRSGAAGKAAVGVAAVEATSQVADGVIGAAVPDRVDQVASDTSPAPGADEAPVSATPAASSQTKDDAKEARGDAQQVPEPELIQMDLEDSDTSGAAEPTAA
jgi:hypothetical protein